MPDDPFGLFHLPPGADFARSFAEGLLRRHGGGPPEALAQVTVWLNSERMRRRVTEALTAAGSRLLPSLRLVSDLAQDPILAGLPPAEPPLRRLLMLGQLVQGLLERDGAIAPASAAFDLAATLTALMDEMQAEGVTPDRTSALQMDQFAGYWQRTQSFLSIIAPYFAQDGVTDGAARQRIAADRLAEAWQAAPPPGPVIVAGSTGSRGPTFRLMLAVARLAKGALVLPGFDDAMPPAVWDAMKDALTAEDHPQYRLRRLIETLGATPAQVRPWAETPALDRARAAVLSLSLRPAPVTDQWLTEGQHLPPLPAALGGVTLVQAETPQAEAAAIALILREGAERGLPSALITPDRALGRRVTAALSEWGILPDDAAGLPLALSPPGRFLRHLARMMTERTTADALIVLLKHPLCHSQERRGEHLRLTRELELSLRADGPAFPTAQSLSDWARGQSDPFAAEWALALGGCMDRLAAAPPRCDLAQAQALHLALAEAFARGTAPEGTGELWREEAGAHARALVAELAAEAQHGAPVSPGDYQRLFETVIHQMGQDQREVRAVHPLITILGPREARESGAVRVVLGGLNEGTWPRQTTPDPWMNRRMRQEVGLLLPERQIGLAAHDYQQAAGAPEVFMTRARRDAEAETVPSRWLIRLTNLLNGLPDREGPQALAEMTARGDRWLALAARLAAPGRSHMDDPALARAPRPSPRPPVAARPDRLSLSRIGDLLRDPYSIYASRVLGLRKLDPLHAPPDARDRGTLMHAVMEEFIRDAPGSGEPADAARARLVALARRILDERIAFPTERLLWQAQMEKAAAGIVEAEARRAGRPVALEQSGEMVFDSPRFVLHGRLDRADLQPDGRLELIDYKTGTPPSEKVQKAFEKQLLLTALMAEAGAFAGLGGARVARISYVGLRDQAGTVTTEIDDEILSALEQGFVSLIRSYAQRETGYTSRRALKLTDDARDFDHLARYGEWQMSDSPVAINVGTEGEQTDAPA